MNADEGFDVVVSSYGPRACHFIGSDIKKNAPSVFWVADYRDMWSIRHNSDLKGRQKYKEKKLEKDTVKNADLITTVSGPLVVQLSGFLERDVELVSNGYDLSLPAVERKIELAKGSARSGEAYNIVYTGMIYPGWQDPSPLLVAVNELVKEEKILSSQIHIHFFGKRQPGLKNIVSQFNAESYVKIHGHVSRERALKEQANADFLLLLESGDETANGVLTGKVFEYMVSGKPVLSLGSKRNSAIGQLINETGIGFVCENDVKIIKLHLLDMITDNRGEFFSPQLNKIKKYNRELQSKDLLSLIERQIS